MPNISMVTAETVNSGDRRDSGNSRDSGDSRDNSDSEDSKIVVIAKTSTKSAYCGG